MRKLFLVGLFLALGASAVMAIDKHDYSSPGNGTAPGYEVDGDSVNTYTVTCTSTSATALRPATVDRSRRRLHIQNRSLVFQVNLGSSTVMASNLWTLGESTNTATSPLYDTYNTGPINCTISNASTTGTAATATVQVIEEYATQDRSGNP